MRSLPPDEPAARSAQKPMRVRVELTCLLCGELAGHLENQRVVWPRVPGSVRYDGRQLTCGRCGSIVIAGDAE